MGLVIDTNFFIDVEHKRLELKNLDVFSSYGEAYIASITAAELLTGIHVAQNMAVKLKRSAFVEHIIKTIPMLDFDEAVARTYAEIYAYFLKPRNKANSNVHDLQIAATALAYGYPVLTNNKADFKIVPGLKVLSLDVT